MIVVDASAVVAALTGADHLSESVRRHIATSTSLAASHLLDAEVMQVLRLMEQKSEHRIAKALADYAGLPIERYPLFPLLDRTWELRHHATTHEAVYLALAESLDVPLLTIEPRLAAIPGISCEVFVPDGNR